MSANSFFDNFAMIRYWIQKILRFCGIVALLLLLLVAVATIFLFLDKDYEPTISLNTMELPVVRTEYLLCDSARIAKLTADFATHKSIPQEAECAILIALSHYPELKNLPIQFEFADLEDKILTANTPLATLFLPWKNRSYRININTQSHEYLSDSLRFQYASLNVQVAMIARGLTLIRNIADKPAYQILNKSYLSLNPAYRAEAMQKADEDIIAHGLGFQLYEWRSQAEAFIIQNPQSIAEISQIPQISTSKIRFLMRQIPIYREEK
ncbi:MAG: hypothetical protein JJT94_08795 [Bernardetiaceae bacterium]|nr:hypothetical protein [Bernardetiaceae bacterium]